MIAPRTFMRLITCAMSLVALTAPSFAQSFSGRPVRVIVGFATGGINDGIARILAAKLPDRIGTQVVVENRPGASGVIAAEHLATASPDSQTLMVVSIAHTANPSLYKLRFDTEAFTPIAQIGGGSSLITANVNSPFKTLADLIEHARKKPGEVKMAISGYGTFGHLAGVQLFNRAGIDVLVVPYKGGGPLIVDLLGGRIDMIIVSLVSVSGHVSAGRMRVLAVTGTQREPTLPDVPTVAESGMPAYEAMNWWGVVGPPKMPKPIVDGLIAAISAVQDDKSLQDLLEKEGARVIKRTGADFGKHIASEIERWAEVIKKGNIKTE